LFKSSSVTDITISGTTIDNAGTSSDIYYNTNNLMAEIGIGKTEAELIDQTNEIYNTWNFENVWYFDNSVSSLSNYPQLKIAYEYNGSITFNVSFDEKLADQEKILLIELTNGSNLNYGVALTNESLSQTIEKLAEDNYVINVYTLLGGKISFDAEELNITLNESVDENITINFVITKTEVNGYYGKVVIK
jgi:hypothetical protein